MKLIQIYLAVFCQDIEIIYRIMKMDKKYKWKSGNVEEL